MAIHGFAHTSSWSVAAQKDHELVLELTDTPELLAQFPFRFRAELGFRVADGVLTITQRFENTGDQMMPYSFGFHPYFLIQDLANAQVETTAKSYFDFMAGKMVELGHGTVGVTMPDGAPETGSAFMGVTGPTILHIPAEGRKITLENDGNYPQNVLWSQRGKAFLCVEPINGTADGLNTGVYRTLEPGQTAEAVLNIRIELI
jgi:galactose mutarotase-like enzyme